MKCSNCNTDLTNDMIFCPNCGKKNTQIEKTMEKNNRWIWYSLLSFILALIPIALVTGCYIYSGGDLSENGSGAVFWLVFIYFLSIGFPIAGCSIFLGIKSYKIKKNIFAVSSALLGSLPYLFVAGITILGYIMQII